MIERKKIQAFLVLVPTAMVLLACGLSGEEEEPEEEKVVIDYSNIPLDPYGCYIEDEDWIAENKGVYLLRDGVYYSLNSYVSGKERPEYNVVQIRTDHNQLLFDRSQGRMGDDIGLYVYTFGDYDLLVLNKDTDEIRSYGVSSVDLVKLENLKFGLKPYKISDMWVNDKKIETTEGWIEVLHDCKEFQYTLDGEVLENTYNLEYETEVTASWYQGTTYNEYTCVANTGYFYAKGKDVYQTLGDDSSGPINIEGELHKEGYATYDFSNVEPGTYLVLSLERPSTKFGETCLTGGGILVIE